MRASLTSWSLFLIVFCGSALYHASFGYAKEVEVTKEWKLLGENDTIPAGMHVRMDMTTGEKWVKQIDKDEEVPETHMAAAVIQEDGSVEVLEEPPNKEGEPNVQESKTYDYEMMHRTLSKLPDEEKDRFGGLPELPQSGDKVTITSKEREAFEKRMGEIWEKRQAELKELQEQVVDLPEVLKERIKSIRNYLKDPETHLNGMRLEEDIPEGMVTHLVSVLHDLEFQLTDVDMARDFHTLGGWQLLVSLLSEDVHSSQNKTISKLSRNMEAKIRSIQAHAAWAIGTAVKNTGEFFPFAVEEVKIVNGDRGKTTAVDLLVDVFCKDYKDAKAWEIRTLLSKAVYGIGALLRGNRMAQAHACKTGTIARLGDKLRQFSIGINSTNTKLIQRLLSLAGDVVSDVKLHGEESTVEVNNEIISSLTSSDWCDSTSNVLLSKSFLPVQLQETLLQTIEVLAPNCAWNESIDTLKTAIAEMGREWQQNRDDFDPEHLEQLQGMVEKALSSLEQGR